MYMVANLHNTYVLLPMDVKGLEGFIQSLDKRTSRFLVSHFGAPSSSGWLTISGR